MTVTIRRGADGGGIASFGEACAACPLRSQCTTAGGGRTIRVGIHEDVLARSRQRQADPEWQADYRATRPKSNANSLISCAANTAGAAPE